MVDNTLMNMVTRSISRSDPGVHTVPTFDLGISQTEEEDALPSEEVRGIRHKRKVTDDVPSSDNDYDELVKENGKYKNYPWGKKAFKDLVKSISKNMDAQKQYYRIHGMPLAMQVWLYGCCSAVDPKISFKQASRILGLLNRETTDRRPHFEAFIKGMLANVDNPGPNVEVVADIPTVPQSSPQDTNASHFSVSNQSDTSTVELQRHINVIFYYLRKKGKYSPPKFLIGGQGVPNQEFDIALLHT
ncbi:hypothetical protein FXO38_02838 [Capsicum annuum]|nr:hypothetical protein FXO37_09280 [Capsicum annuum]KAF3679254.1 hypothetical protein FXO38_02838 [Capsicum annuum]